MKNKPSLLSVGLKNLNILIILIIIALSFTTGYLFFKIKNLENKTTVNEASKAESSQLKKPNDTDHWRGSKKARYVWIEYSDLECPFCKSIHPDLIKLQNVYSGKLAWVYRHFPLPFHPLAQKSAEATECAAQQKGDETFFKMVDAIFQKMPQLPLDQLPTLAKDQGLDAEKFKKCLDNNKFQNKVKKHFEEGSKAGVQGTPYSFLYDTETGNFVTAEGALAYEQLRKVVDDFMAKNN